MQADIAATLLRESVNLLHINVSCLLLFIQHQNILSLKAGGFVLCIHLKTVLFVFF